ncbi:hypothetical protein ACFL3V_02540 [Nanoarchaeota archaeon]
MSEDTYCRNDVALVAHRDARILILRMEGYRELSWRLPQGPLRQGLDLIKKRQRMGVEHEMVLDLLEERIGSRDANLVRYTGIKEHFYFSEIDQGIEDLTVTASTYPTKRLHFYIVELYCPDSVIRQGVASNPRIKDWKLVDPSDLKCISQEERRGVKQVLDDYLIDMDAPVEIKND